MSDKGKPAPQRRPTSGVVRRGSPIGMDMVARLFENTSESIFALSEDGKPLLVNPAFARLTGYSTAQEFLHVRGTRTAAEVQPVVHAALDDQDSAGGNDRVPPTLALRHRDGSPIWVSLQAQRIEHTEGTFIACFMRRAAAPHPKDEHLAWLAKAIEDTDVALWCQDPHGTIQTWNRGAAVLSGWSRQEAVGQSGSALLLANEHQQEEDAVVRRSDDGEARRVEGQLRTRSGSLVDVTATYSPIHSRSGEVTGTVVTVHDARQRRRREEMRLALARNEEETRRLHQVTHSRQEYIDQAVHELKTPLTPLVAHLHILKGKGGWDGAALKSIQIIDRNATRMASLVHDLTDASWLAADRLRLERRPTELRRLVRDVAESFHEHARAEGVAVETRNEGSAILSVDRARLTQVLFNLLSNAIKFTARGGTVRIELETNEGAAVVQVRDTGLGLTDEQLERLFQPFAVFHPKQNSGTGLGLFISKGIIEAHGGTMWAQSKGPGHGTIVGFRLPQRPSSPAQTPSVLRRRAARGSEPTLPRQRARPDSATRRKQRERGGRP